MTRTRGRLFDLVAATGGLLILLLALALVDHRIRDPFMSSAGLVDVSRVGQDLNYVAMATTLMAAQLFRGQWFEQSHLLVFTVTAVVLVVLLMRL